MRKVAESENLWLSILISDYDGNSDKNRHREIINSLIEIKFKKELLIAFLALLTISLGIIGVFEYNYLMYGDISRLDNALYIASQLLVLESSINSPPLFSFFNIARFLALFTILVSSLFFLSWLIENQTVFWKYRFKKDHTIIIGNNNVTSKLFESFESQGEDITLFNPLHSLNSTMSNSKMFSSTIETNCSFKAFYEGVRMDKAANLIIVTNNDLLNVELLDNAISYLESHKSTTAIVKCFVMIKDIDLYRNLKKQSYFPETHPHYSLTYFNVLDLSTRLLFHKFPLDQLTDTINIDIDPLHVAIVGFTDIAQFTILRVARLGHFYNQKPVHITVYDTDPISSKSTFTENYPCIEEDIFIEKCRIEFKLFDTKKANQLNKSFLTLKYQPDAIYICYNNDLDNVTLGLDLSENISYPIFVHVKQDLFKMFQGKLTNIIPFGMFKEVCTKDLIVNESLSTIAQTIHENYLRTSHSIGIKTNSKQSGEILRPWKELPEIFREFNLNQADHIPVKIRAISANVRKKENRDIIPFAFRKDEIEKLARIEHSRFTVDRTLAGYTYADILVTDHRTKESPFLIPYDQLSESVQEDDRESVRNITRIVSFFNLEICRSDKTSE